jgi:hypothetical protein
MSRSRLNLIILLALIAAGVTVAQAMSVFITGEELCVGESCALVGSLTRIPPSWFNLMGGALFSAVAGLALLTRHSGKILPLTLMHLALTGALAAEGVLFAYQWHVAGYWCIYCLCILSVLVVLNLLLGFRRCLYGLGAFVASATIFSLLSFMPFYKSLDDGTLATMERPMDKEVFLIFSEHCPHCKNVLKIAEKSEECTIRYNPIGPLSASVLPELDRNPDVDYRPNLAAAQYLGIDTIPILIANQGPEKRVLTGETPIREFLEEHCLGVTTAPEPDPFGSGAMPSVLDSAEDDGCGIVTDCD